MPGSYRAIPYLKMGGAVREQAKSMEEPEVGGESSGEERGEGEGKWS
jgi:hypothetical protein